MPDAAGRAEILQVLLRGVPHAMMMDDSANTNNTRGGDGGAGSGGGGGKSSQSGAQKVRVKDLAERTHGFVGADLQLLVKEAALQAIRRTRWGAGRSSDRENLPESATGDDDSVEQLPTLTPADFLAALPLVSPSGLREVAVEVPSVKWGDIGGMEGVKQSLREVRLPAPAPAPRSNNTPRDASAEEETTAVEAMFMMVALTAVYRSAVPLLHKENFIYIAKRNGVRKTRRSE